MKTLIILSSALFLTGCFDNSEAKTVNQDSIQLGKISFEKNCITCHGRAGEGVTKDWKKKGTDGKYPAPPINGTAHAWHHSPKALLVTLNNGGIKLGGSMPAFKDKLSEAEKQSLLNYIYSLWPESIQKKYDSRFK